MKPTLATTAFLWTIYRCIVVDALPLRKDSIVESNNERSNSSQVNLIVNNDSKYSTASPETPYYPTSIWDCYNKTLRAQMELLAVPLRIKGLSGDDGGEQQLVTCLELAVYGKGSHSNNNNNVPVEKKQRKNLNCWDPEVRYNNAACRHFFNGGTEADLTPVFLVFVIMSFAILIICLTRIRNGKSTTTDTITATNELSAVVLEVPIDAHQSVGRPRDTRYLYQERGWLSAPSNRVSDPIPSYDEAVRVKVDAVLEPPSYSEAIKLCQSLHKE